MFLGIGFAAKKFLLVWLLKFTQYITNISICEQRNTYTNISICEQRNTYNEP